MFEHHTKTLGDYGVLKAQLCLFEKGWLILQPQTEHAPFDLVAYKDGVFNRIQVKSRSMYKGCVRVAFSNQYFTSTGLKKTIVDKSEIDLYCIYIPNIDKCIFFDPKGFGNSNVNFRLEPTKNKQKIGVNLIEDYLEI